MTDQGDETKLRRARRAAGMSQGEVHRKLAEARRRRNKMPPKLASLKRQYTAWESGRVKPTDWREELCEVFGLPAAALGLADTAETPPAAPTSSGIPPEQREFGDDEYLHSVRGYIQNLVSLDNRFGGDDLVRMSYRFFQSLHELIGSGRYDQRLERDFNAAAGELAEVVGWLAYDAEKHQRVREMNHESLYYTRLAGDRSIELLTIQNASMHAGAMGRPGEALQLARSVLEGREALTPRLRALFLTRKARALAQAGDESAISLFGEIKSLYLDGVADSDPPWAWWIDERELAWHEAMAKRDLQQSGLAIAEFEHSVEATAPSETRSQYLHRAYLLQAQVELGSWADVEQTVKSIIPLVKQVASTRTAVILRNAIAKVATRTKVPDSIATSIAQLSIALDTTDL
ncbi:helix-turn-helix transcriptional regulator [Amycolatopsis dongchuanensis]|uniref:HTH cro/C1-type domain-containing protein n=1 Tax=Amycolatopsis dongchuanensis TaxID=1070866 RepID=A0ABP8VIE3_9PSEU